MGEAVVGLLKQREGKKESKMFWRLGHALCEHLDPKGKLQTASDPPFWLFPLALFQVSQQLSKSAQPRGVRGLLYCSRLKQPYTEKRLCKGTSRNLRGTCSCFAVPSRLTWERDLSSGGSVRLKSFTHKCTNSHTLLWTTVGKGTFELT